MNIENIFWIVQLPLMLIFIIGLLRVVNHWRGIFQVIYKQLPSAIKGFILDGWLNRRLWHTSRSRWLSHALLLNGFLLLMLLSALSVISEKLLLPTFPSLSEIPLIMIWVGRDHIIKALLNEIGSLVITIGLLFYIIRRYFLRPPQLRTSNFDTWIVTALSAILLTGWLTEAVRINASHPGKFISASFFGSILARMLSSLHLPWPALFEFQYLFHGLLASLVISLIPYSKFMHAPAAGITTALANLPDHSSPSNKIYTSRQHIEMMACTSCGECIPWCPTFNEKTELDTITPLRKISTLRQTIYDPRGLQIPIEEHAEGVYDCTLCGRCSEVCPVHIQTRDLWIAMRCDLVEKQQHPHTLNTLRETLLNYHNLSGDDNLLRMVWAQNLPEKQPEPQVLSENDQTKTLYFTGCVASFYPASFSIPRAMTFLLEYCKADYSLLGGEEWCCGFPLYAAGMHDAAMELIHHNLQAVRRSGAKQLLVTCPSCYHMWQEQVPRLTGEHLDFEVIHAVDWLDHALTAGALQLKPLQARVTYHDPCDLGRVSGIYETPRKLLQAIPDLDLHEMQHNHALSLCCGGGGDVEMNDEALVANVARRRILEAQETDAEYLVSACQQCKRTLATAARGEKLPIRVLDIVELIAAQL
jgi:heterodisulfide reductase subunit D